MASARDTCVEIAYSLREKLLAVSDVANGIWKCDEYDVNISRRAGAESGATTNARTPSRIIAHTATINQKTGRRNEIELFFIIHIT